MLNVCARCGRYFSPEEQGSGEGTRVCKGPLGYWAETIDYCPDCSRQRQGMVGTVFKAVCFLVGALLLIVLLGLLGR